MSDINSISNIQDVIRNLGSENNGKQIVGNAVGHYKGQNVTAIPSMQSILQAAEELSFKASQFRSTDISKRKIRDKAASIAKLEEQASEFYESVKRINKGEQINRVVEKLSNNVFSDSNNLKQFLSSELSDISDQFMALAIVKKLKKGSQVVINEVLREFSDKNESEIKAGFNVFKTAQKFETEKLDNIGNLRNFYRETILNYKNLSSAFNDVIKKYSDINIQKAIAFLLQGLGVELKVSNSSLDKEKLRQILSDLKKLKLLNTLFDQVTLIFSRLKKEPQADSNKDLKDDI